ncbi:MAG: ATP-binding protein [Promethearchaeota archaeon]
MSLISKDISKHKIDKQIQKKPEELYRKLFETSPNMIILINNQGEIIDLNTKTLEFLNLEKENVIGKDLEALSFIPAEMYHNLKKKFRKILEKRSIDSIELQLENLGTGRKWISTQGSLVQLKDENLIQLTIQDITTKKKAEFLIKEQVKKLQELDQKKTDFVNRASHEIKTPIASIYGACQLLYELYKDDLNEEASELLNIALRSGARLKHLIYNLFDVSKIDAYQFKLTKHRMDLITIFKECINDLSYLINTNSLQVSLDCPKELYIVADEFKIEEVILNILMNSIKNTPSGGSIFCHIRKKEKYVEVSVKDTGIGITKNEIKKLFTKFGKLERRGIKVKIDSEGSGLGLYLSKKIINLHEGQIWAESEGRNKGTTIIFTLPLT